MIRALLLDLDDTLLENDVDQFLPAYLQRLGAFVDDLVPADRFIPLLLKATRAMVENTDPERTLDRVFAAAFYPALGISEEALRPRLDDFYSLEFPRLRSLTAAVPEAPAVVEQARARGLEVVVATNPLFPLTAIEQRLEWAGVPAHENDYALVTSYETVHFTKPSPAYYAEALALLGRLPSEAAMVGDNFDADLAPARLLGIAVYHISAEPDQGHPGGPLRGVPRWLDDLGRTPAAPSLRDPNALLPTLAGDLAALRTLASRLPTEAWRSRPAPEGWSAVEMVCHLRDAEIEVNLPRLDLFRRQSGPFLSAVDTDRWVRERDYQSQDPAQALASLTRARKELLTRLAGLSPEDWRRPARHSLLGPTTLAEVVALIAEHERLHLAALRTASLHSASARL